MLFMTLIPNLNIKIFNSKNFRAHRKFENFENAWDVKKSKFENHIERGPIICKMTRGFQIWPHNSNRITFDPLFGPKTVESRDVFNNP